MRLLSLGRLMCGVALALALPVALVRGQAQADKAATNSERVKFDSVDGVELLGAWYPSSRGNKAPCVVLLHEIGGNSHQEGWAELATELQKKGFAVLAFDFRGHGDSKEISPQFYQDPINKTIRGALSAKSRDRIEYKSFTNVNHYAMLVQDIAAAKRFLDRKNDAGECNSSDTVVIGADSGATLGAFWIATEWKRQEAIRNPLGFPIGRGEPEGKNIAAAVWLSISPNLGTARVNVANWLRSPVREKVPMYFINGAQDKNAALAKYLHDSVLKANTDKSLKFTGMKVLPDSAKLAGRDLLGKKSLGTEELIVKYLEKVMEDRGTSVWTKKDVDKNPLVRVPVEQFLR